MPQLILLVSCSSQKSQRVPPELRLSENAHTQVEARVTSWTRTLLATDWSTRAERLYRGQYWGVVRRLRETLSLHYDCDLIVASAGMGLLRGADIVPSYSATFDPGSRDSVIPVEVEGLHRNDYFSKWWELLNHALAHRKKVRALSDVISSEAPVIVSLLSGPYLSVLVDELIEIEKSREVAVLVFAPRSDSSARKLHGHIPLNAGIQDTIGGSRGTLAVRMALKFFSERKKTERPSASECRQFFDRVASESSVALWPVRRPVSDDFVRSFVRQEQASGTTAYTPALRALRGSGYACEMRRFKAIFLKELQNGQR